MVLHTAIQDHRLVAQLKFDRHTKYFVRFAQSPQQNEGVGRDLHASRQEGSVSYRYGDKEAGCDLSGSYPGGLCR